jgi:hypothetical protein
MSVDAQRVAEFMRGGTLNIVRFVECDSDRHVGSEELALSKMRSRETAIQIRIEPDEDVSPMRQPRYAIFDESARGAYPLVESRFRSLFPLLIVVLIRDEENAHWQRWPGKTML